MKFKGTADELRQAIVGAQFRIKKVEEGENTVIYRLEGGGVCTWSPSTGTIVVSGKLAEREALEAEVTKFVKRRAEREAKAARGPSPAAAATNKPGKKKIFIVHGHDHGERTQLELVLRELGVSAIVGMKEDSAGRTIIEHLERHIRPGSSDSAHFGIALLTPDDVGHARKDGGRESKPRARQNAILELGMLMGSLGRKNVAMLMKGSLELPSDLHGVLRLDYQSHVRETVPQLAQRLIKAGFTISPDAVAKAALK